MWEKEKLLVTSHFSFSHVFYRYISLVCKNAVLCGNGLKGRRHCQKRKKKPLPSFDLHLDCRLQWGQVCILLMWYWYLITKQWNVGLVQSESHCRQQNKQDIETEIRYGKSGKKYGKSRKQDFVLFAKMFSRASFPRFVKICDCFVKGQPMLANVLSSLHWILLVCYH